MSTTSISRAVSGVEPPSRFLLQHTCVVVPTYNASRYWDRLRTGLERQGISSDQVFIIDSSSTDNTRELARQAGFRLVTIPTSSFRHGTTRQMAAEYVRWAKILVYLTQDAIPCGDNSIARLVDVFQNGEIGAAYGRQLPREDADPIEVHARLFNYPETSDVRGFECRKRLGLKAAFSSNSFAAYRRSALDEVGGFPNDTIVSEEMIVAARMLMANWKVAYQADALVIHSHPFTLLQEFSRYFDIGVNLGNERWLGEIFGGAGGEGRSFVLSEMQFLMKTRPSLVPLALLRNVSKWIGFQLGLHGRHLPIGLKKAISAQPYFWEDCLMPSLTSQFDVTRRRSRPVSDSAA